MQHIPPPPPPMVGYPPAGYVPGPYQNAPNPSQFAPRPQLPTASISNGPPKATTSKTPAKPPKSFEGYEIRPTVDGEVVGTSSKLRPSWKICERKEMPFSQSDLEKMVKDRRSQKKDPIVGYKKLISYQKTQVGRVLEEKKLSDDKEWSVVYVKKHTKYTQAGTEACQVDVIFKRQDDAQSAGAAKATNNGKKPAATAPGVSIVDVTQPLQAKGKAKGDAGPKEKKAKAEENDDDIVRIVEPPMAPLHPPVQNSMPFVSQAADPYAASRGPLPPPQQPPVQTRQAPLATGPPRPPIVQHHNTQNPQFAGTNRFPTGAIPMPPPAPMANPNIRRAPPPTRSRDLPEEYISDSPATRRPPQQHGPRPGISARRNSLPTSPRPRDGRRVRLPKGRVTGWAREQARTPDNSSYYSDEDSIFSSSDDSEDSTGNTSFGELPLPTRSKPRHAEANRRRDSYHGGSGGGGGGGGRRRNRTSQGSSQFSDIIAEVRRDDERREERHKMRNAISEAFQAGKEARRGRG